MADQKDIFAVISREEVFSIVKKFKNHLLKMGIPVEKIILYGSYAKENPRYGSDIDICVISRTFRDRWESRMLLRREAADIDFRIEPVAYHPEKFEDWLPLVWEIQQTGIEVN